MAEYFCACCRTPFLNAAPLDENGVCRLCRSGLTGFDAVYTYGDYDGVLRELIHLFKFSGIKPLARPLGQLLRRSVPRDIQVDVIIPMPLHWKRKWERGFNQSELLADELSRHLGAPVSLALQRHKHTPAQAGLTLHERRRNVASAFSVRHQQQLENKHVLLIDDVLTTGATIAAASAALKKAGARRVSGLTLARADRRQSVSWTVDTFRSKGVA